MLAPEGTRLHAEEARFFRDADPWGFILFARNLDNARQIAHLTSALRDTVGRAAPILIDQEGGRVQRLRPPLARDWPPPLEEVGRAGVFAERVMEIRYQIIARELLDLGIDTNCAPCADVASVNTHPFLRNRCYGDTPDHVARVASAVAKGLLSGGVLPVIKHLPGHGRATVDSHLTTPSVDAQLEALRATDFAAFKGISGLPLGMSAHVRYLAVDDARPATISPPMIRIIRDEIGFGGLLMSDDISMEALPGNVAERALGAIEAGCDVVLHCNGSLPEMIEIANAAGTLGREAAARAERALERRSQPEPIDIAALQAELEALRLGGQDERHG
ncbi:MAG: glycoside hydrolase family 3 N-terminal domain-containing protein [Pseudomonadota bacterium]